MLCVSVSCSEAKNTDLGRMKQTSYILRLWLHKPVSTASFTILAFKVLEATFSQEAPDVASGADPMLRAKLTRKHQKS